MNRNLYTKIAYWYYVLGLTQDEIARRLGYTRQKVNQMINGLKEQDIVHITVRGFEEENAALECALEEKFGLKECIVAADYGEPETAIYKVALMAAQYLESTIRSGDTIGISWGRTLAMTIFNLPIKPIAGWFLFWGRSIWPRRSANPMSLPAILPINWIARV